MLQILLTTISHRPYVVIFLLAYLVIAIRTTGIRWTFFFLICGYLIAFMAEFLSINHGFPFGWYFYKYHNLTGEWLNSGVPVWDSVSFVFMSFAGLGVARYALCVRRPAQKQNGPISRIGLIGLSAVLVTLLDIIIDPVAHLGARWFLGDIYFYLQPGPYFGITLANFAGWFLVSFLINSVGVFVLNFDKVFKPSRINTFSVLGLYFGIFGFGISIALYLQEWKLVLCDAGWCVAVIALIFAAQRRLPTKPKLT